MTDINFQTAEQVYCSVHFTVKNIHCQHIQAQLQMAANVYFSDQTIRNRLEENRLSDWF